MPLYMYVVQTRQQDEGWTDDKAYGSLHWAVVAAEYASRDALHGMARVVATPSCEVLVTFPAGHAPLSFSIQGERVTLLSHPSVEAAIAEPGHRDWYDSNGRPLFVPDKLEEPLRPSAPQTERQPRFIRIREKGLQ